MTTQKQILLECTICLEEFKDPRIIDCHHSFCLLCLTDFIKKRSTNGRFNCPICRVKISVPSGGATAFPTNFYVNVIRENYQGEEKSAISSKDFCDTHPKKMFEFYCVDCEAILCSKCVIAKHKPHTVLDVDLPEVKQMIYDRMATTMGVVLEGTHKKYGDHLDVIKEELKQSVASAEKEISGITNHVEDLCRQVRERGNELIADIRKVISDNTKAVEKFENKFKGIDGFMDETHSLFEMVNIIHTAIRVSFVDLNPPVLQLVKFQESESSLSDFQIGDIIRGHCIRFMKIPAEKFPFDQTEKFPFDQTSPIPEFKLKYEGSEYHLESEILEEDLYLSLVRVCEDAPHSPNPWYLDICVDELEMAEYEDSDQSIDFMSITLVNNINNKESICRKFKDGCFRTFIEKWKTLMDSANGFLDTVDTEKMLTVMVAKYHLE